MTQTATSETLRERLARSGLLSAEEADPVFADAGPSATGRAVAESLVRHRLLTPFQARQLLAGRPGGFFLDRKFKVLDFIGSGGMGRVYLAEHLMLHRLVALKLLRPSGKIDPKELESAVARFHREARAVAAIDHDHIVNIFDVDRAGDVPYMVMEYVDGTNLFQLVNDRGPLPPPRALEYARQTALGLAAAHEANLIHRDVKPSNMVLDRLGAVRLLDLGLARFVGGAGGRNQSVTARYDMNSVLGTIDFMSPEQATDSSLADARSDLYSLGCSLYYMLTARLPHPSGTPAQKIAMHLTRAPEPLSVLVPRLPAETIAIVERLMAKDPEERPASAREVAAELAKLIAAPVGPPPASEMPKLPASYYRLGLPCAPPSTVGPLPEPPSSPSDSATNGVRSSTHPDGVRAPKELSVADPSILVNTPASPPLRVRKAIPWAVLGVVALFGSALALWPPFQRPSDAPAESRPAESIPSPNSRPPSRSRA